MTVANTLTFAPEPKTSALVIVTVCVPVPDILPLAETKSPAAPVPVPAVMIDVVKSFSANETKVSPVAALNVTTPDAFDVTTNCLLELNEESLAPALVSVLSVLMGSLGNLYNPIDFSGF